MKKRDHMHMYIVYVHVTQCVCVQCLYTQGGALITHNFLPLVYHASNCLSCAGSNSLTDNKPQLLVYTN